MAGNEKLIKLLLGGGALTTFLTAIGGTTVARGLCAKGMALTLTAKKIHAIMVARGNIVVF